MNCDLVETRVGDCGCPEEVYCMSGVELTVHYEPNGDADAHLDAGPDYYEYETTIEGLARDAARAAVISWAESIVYNGESV